MSKPTLLLLIVSVLALLSGCSQDVNNPALSPAIDVNSDCNWIYTYDNDWQIVCCVWERVCLMMTSDEKCVLRVWSNWQYQWITSEKDTCNDEIYFNPIRNNNCYLPPSTDKNE